MVHEKLAALLDTRSAIVLAQGLLEEAGISEAALEAEVAVRHVLGIDRAGLYSHPERPLTPAQRAALEALLARRYRREPLPYILGSREFYGLTFHVTPAVLVPRPETESLVEEVLCWARDVGGSLEPLTIADIGTGSGCIATSLAVHLPQATVIASDTSPGALTIAGENLRYHKMEQRVRLLQGELLAPLPEPVDLIVANLPYVSESDLDNLPPEIRDYEPREALSGGPDGMSLLRSLLEQAPAYLRLGGVVMVEMDPRQRGAMGEIARRCFPHASLRVAQDLAGLDRVLVVATACL